MGCGNYTDIDMAIAYATYYDPIHSLPKRLWNRAKNFVCGDDFYLDVFDVGPAALVGGILDGAISSGLFGSNHIIDTLLAGIVMGAAYAICAQDQQPTNKRYETRRDRKAANGSHFWVPYAAFAATAAAVTAPLLTPLLPTVPLSALPEIMIPATVIGFVWDLRCRSVRKYGAVPPVF